jgi:hypothetical protein
VDEQYARVSAGVSWGFVTRGGTVTDLCLPSLCLSSWITLAEVFDLLETERQLRQLTALHAAEGGTSNHNRLGNCDRNRTFACSPEGHSLLPCELWEDKRGTEVML